MITTFAAADSINSLMSKLNYKCSLICYTETPHKVCNKQSKYLFGQFLSKIIHGYLLIYFISNKLELKT